MLFLDMRTCTIQIGNSDDKLTQKEWSNFVLNVEYHIQQYATQIHFAGGSHGNASWQNYAWVFGHELQPLPLKAFLGGLKSIRSMYKQDSLEITFGDTDLI